MANILPPELRRTPAERARQWREAKKAAGAPYRSTTRGKSGKSKRKFTKAEFVAIDGEGFSEGDEKTWHIGANKKPYTGKPHYYAYLSASDGSEIYAKDGRLSTEQCLEFLLNITTNNKHAVIVAFGASYDMTHMLYDLSLDELKALLAKDKDKTGFLDKDIGAYSYRLEIRPRKTLTVRAWARGAPKYEKNKRGQYVLSPHRKAVVWDVWGFFQDSFAGVMRKWIPDHPDYQFILRMKGERSIFQRSELSEIRRYNAAELRCLVAIMDKLRGAVDELGLKLSRWDGAGAIAGAILKMQGVKEHKAETPGDVFEAARHAYSGGHIEAMQIGHYEGPVYHYDVNSAYPAQFAELPSLEAGVWQHGTSSTPPHGFTLVRVAFAFNYGNSFYPLFYREDDGSIRYPREGEGWYWFAEYAVAREYFERFGGERFEVKEFWHFKESRKVRPFGWIRDYYAQRQSRIADAKRRGVEDGPEKIIKLGLNSLYGKTAQQLGARRGQDGETQKPPYFQLEWAGAVTAGCRAEIMRAAIQNPISVISLATDGIFTTAPLDLDISDKKELGKWEGKTHAGITVVMPGVYWLHDEKGIEHFSRGFDKRAMSDPEFIYRAWRAKLESCDIELTRMSGLGTACHGGAHFEMRGMFISSTRALALNGGNSKRYPVALYKYKPHKGLVPTLARDREGLYISAPFDISWIGSDFEEEREALDADLA